MDPKIRSLVANVLDKMVPRCFGKVTAACIIWPTISGANALGPVHVAAMIHRHHLGQGNSFEENVKMQSHA